MWRGLLTGINIFVYVEHKSSSTILTGKNPLLIFDFDYMEFACESVLWWHNDVMDLYRTGIFSTRFIILFSQTISSKRKGEKCWETLEISFGCFFFHSRTIRLLKKLFFNKIVQIVLTERFMCAIRSTCNRHTHTNAHARAQLYLGCRP